MVASTDPPEVLQRLTSALELVEKIASQMSRTIGPSVSRAELVSFGQEGLLHAARRYDPIRRVPFRSYASVRIRGAMIDGVRQCMPLSRRTWERLRALEAMDKVLIQSCGDVYGGALPGSAQSADDVLSNTMASMATAMVAAMVAQPAVGDAGELVVAEDDGPEAVLLRRELRGQFERAITELPHEEGELIRRHYLDGERFDHVAASLGLSKSWASRLHRRALERLTKRFAFAD